MRKRIAIIAVAAVTSLALLFPAGSAQAASGSANWCGATDQRDGYYVEPGKICTFYPLATRFVSASWWVRSGGSGFVCLAIIRTPWQQGQVAQALDDWGRPTNWNCANLRQNRILDSSGRPTDWGVGTRPWVTGGFGAVHGQAAILNYSSARIQVGFGYNRVEYYY